ncbi:hypothetical protein [Thalassotalea litorea]|uniref:hypothetical protein n=1 Tax=Thalassotalea litorea TaxID=2020715 RepID=UPI0037369D9C
MALMCQYEQYVWQAILRERDEKRRFEYAEVISSEYTLFRVAYMDIGMSTASVVTRT